jgi:hypothetical protein
MEVLFYQYGLPALFFLVVVLVSAFAEEFMRNKRKKEVK